MISFEKPVKKLKGITKADFDLLLTIKSPLHGQQLSDPKMSFFQISFKISAGILN